MLLSILSIALAAGCAAAAWNARAEERRRSAARVAALAAAIGTDDESPNTGTEAVALRGSLFESATGPGSLRWAHAAAVLVLVTALGLITAVLRRPPADTAPMQEIAAQASSLELLSMRHVRRSGGLTVTGLVRNPPAGVPLSRVDALVLAFDRTGEFVASGAAALEIPTLAPGEESPFAVTLPDVGDLGRYRVTFRTSDALLRHVDRREARRMAAVQP